jgi:hypothetical protein
MPFSSFLMNQGHRCLMSTSKDRRKTGTELIAMDSPRDYETCASRLKALADDERLRIVMRLLSGELTVLALAADLDAPVDKISHHLGVLRAATLAQSRK